MLGPVQPANFSRVDITELNPLLHLLLPGCLLLEIPEGTDAPKVLSILEQAPAVPMMIDEMKETVKALQWPETETVPLNTQAILGLVHPNVPGTH